MNLKAKLIGNEDERAVSPVIGVILMVAITVILAAVIAAFVLDLGQSQSASVNAGVSFSESGGDVTTQLTDSGSAEYVVLQGDDVSNSSTGCASSSDFGEDDADCVLENVGDRVTSDADDDITVIAVDGSTRNVINNWP